MTAAALPREYSHSYSPPIERRLGALLLAVVVLFSPSGILAHRDAYRAGLIATALPLPLVAAYVVTGSADPDIHPASPGFARTLISDETGLAHLPPRGIAVAVRPAQERNHSLLVRTAQSSALRNPVLTPGLTGIDNQGTLSATDYVSLNTWGMLTNSNIVSGQQVSLWANGALTNSGTVVGGQGLSLSAGSVHNIGVLSSGGTLSASTGTTFNNGGTLDARDQLSLYSGGAFTNDGGGQLAILQTGSDLSLMTGGLINRGLIVAQRNLDITATQGDIDNASGAAADSGAIVALQGNLTLNAQTGALANGGALAAGSQGGQGDITASANTAFDNLGQLSARDIAITTTGGSAVLTNRGTIAAADNITLHSAWDAGNVSGGILHAAGTIGIEAVHGINLLGHFAGPEGPTPDGGSAYLPGTINLSAGYVNKFLGSLLARDQLNITTPSFTDWSVGNTTGSLGNASLNLSGSVWDPFTQRIFALGNLTVTTPSLTLNPGQSWAQPGSVTLQGTTLTNHQGTLTVSDNLTVNGSVTNHWGVIQTGQHFTVNGDLTNLRSPASATYTQTAYDTVLGVDQNGNQVRCDVGSGGSGYCRWHEEFGGTEHGNIASGGDITVTGTLHNIASQVVAQGAITAGNLLNESQHLRIVWEEYRDHKSASDTLTPPLYLDPPFNTILNPAANTFFKTPLLGLIAANSIVGGTFVNEGVIQGNTVTLGAGVNGLTNPAIATVIPQNTGNAGQGAASGAAGASQANGTPSGNTVTILGQTVHLAGATVTGTTGGGQGGQGAGPLTGSTTGHSTTVRDADTVAGVTTHNITVATQPTPPTVGVTGNTVISAPDITIGTQTLAGPAVNPTGAAGQTVVVSATLADATINIDPVAVATPAVTVTQGLVNGPTVTPTGAAGTHVTAHVNTSVIVDSPLTTSFTGPDVAVNNTNLLAPHANAPPASAVSGPAVAGQTVPLLPIAIPLSAVNVPPTGGGNNPDSDGILLPDSPPIITPTDRPGTAATAGGSEPITNRTNLLDLSVPAGTIIAGTLNLTGDTRNTGFIHADTINIADTVGRLINERRLANPGQHQYELGNGDYVTERGDRLQPGGFISATNWNINAQSILNLSGTFEVKGLTPEDTAALTAAFKDQLRQLYGANFTDQEVIEHLIRDVHTNKAPNQFRQILAIAIAIAITVMTSGADGGYALTTLLGNQSAIVAAVGGAGSAGAFALNAAFTALLTGASTQLITTGRIDGRALFQNIAIAAVTAGLTHGFTSEFGFTPPTDGSGLTMAQRFTNYAISAGVTGVVQEVAGTGDFRNAFLNSFVSNIAADTARWIGGNIPRTNTFDAAGNVVEANPIGNLVAHAVLGCAAAAAQRTDCASGAIGGATSALVAGQIDKLFDGTSTITHNALTAGTATLVSGLVATALGRDGTVGANAGANEVLNNFLGDPNEVNSERFRRNLERQAACTSDSKCLDNVYILRAKIDMLTDQKIAETCAGKGVDCVANLQKERQLYGNVIDRIAARIEPEGKAIVIVSELGGVCTGQVNCHQIVRAIINHESDPNNPEHVRVYEALAQKPNLMAFALGQDLAADLLLAGATLGGGAGLRMLAGARLGVAEGLVGGANGGTKVAGAANDLAVTGRPTPRQSEIDVGVDLPPGARPQVSFKNGQEVPYGTSGSVRPDYCLGNVCSVEVKNYNITTNSTGLVNNVSQQAIDRAANLPPGMTQTIVIDIRGQTVTTQQLDAIRLQIVQRSNGAVSPNNIRFKDK